MEELIVNPSNVLRLRKVAGARADVAAGTCDTPEKLDASLDRMIERQVEAERVEWDRTNTADRFE